MSFGSNPLAIHGLSSRDRQFGVTSRTNDKTIIISGDKELDAQLKALPAVLRDEYLNKACWAAVNYIVKPAVLAKIPQGEKGNLRRGLRVSKRRRRIGENIVGYKLKMVRPAYHAYIIEFGTEDRVTKQGHERGRVPGRKFAFMRPGLYDNEAKIRRAFKIAVREFIRRGSTKAKYAKRAIEYLEGSP